MKLHLYSKESSMILALVENSLAPKGKMSISVSEKGITMKICGQPLFKNVPLEKLRDEFEKFKTRSHKL